MLLTFTGSCSTSSKLALKWILKSCDRILYYLIFQITKRIHDSGVWHLIVDGTIGTTKGWVRFVSRFRGRSVLQQLCLKTFVARVQKQYSPPPHISIIIIIIIIIVILLISRLTCSYRVHNKNMLHSSAKTKSQNRTRTLTIVKTRASRAYKWTIQNVL